MSFVRAKAESAYHPSCTCRMGERDRIRWRWWIRRHACIGVEGLRVVDSSIMPLDHDRQPERADHHAGGEGG